MSTATSNTTAAAMSTKVAVLGASGGIGQPLSLLLKLSPWIDELACYDIVGTPGVAADLSHVRVVFASAKKKNWSCREKMELEETWEGAAIIPETLIISILLSELLIVVLSS